MGSGHNSCAEILDFNHSPFNLRKMIIPNIIRYSDCSPIPWCDNKIWFGTGHAEHSHVTMGQKTQRVQGSSSSQSHGPSWFLWGIEPSPHRSHPFWTSRLEACCTTCMWSDWTFYLIQWKDPLYIYISYSNIMQISCSIIAHEHHHMFDIHSEILWVWNSSRWVDSVKSFWAMPK